MVLRDLKEANLTINLEKSHFCVSQVRYLGFIVNQEGLHIDSDKVAAVVDYPAPRNIRQLRRFLGMASWYRRFFPDFATVTEPLTLLTEKSQEWRCAVEQERSFEALKQSLTTPPTLSCPNFSIPFVLQTDASSVGLGAVLTQVLEGEERLSPMPAAQ